MRVETIHCDKCGRDLSERKAYGYSCIDGGRDDEFELCESCKNTVVEFATEATRKTRRKAEEKQVSERKDCEVCEHYTARHSVLCQCCVVGSNWTRREE